MVHECLILTSAMSANFQPKSGTDATRSRKQTAVITISTPTPPGRRAVLIRAVPSSRHRGSRSRRARTRSARCPRGSRRRSPARTPVRRSRMAGRERPRRRRIGRRWRTRRRRAEPSHQLIGTLCCSEAVGGRPKNDVAVVVDELIVDPLEAVQVQLDDGCHVLGRSGALEHQRRVFLEHATIGERRELISVCLVPVGQRHAGGREDGPHR